MHVGMECAVVLERANFCKHKADGFTVVHCAAVKGFVIRCHGVRGCIVISPGYCSVLFNRNVSRRITKARNSNFIGGYSCL
jgi:hypothetical protein